MSHTLDCPRGTNVWNSLKKPKHIRVFRRKQNEYFFKHQFEQNKKREKRKISVELTLRD